MSDCEILPKEWALFVYFTANVPEAEVRKAAIENLLQLANVGSSDEVAVAAQLHLPGKFAYRYVMPERPPGSGPLKLAPVESFLNENSVDPRTIIRFFRWAAARCPATNTILVIWGHGYSLDDYLPRGTRPHPFPPRPGTAGLLCRELLEADSEVEVLEADVPKAEVLKAEVLEAEVLEAEVLEAKVAEAEDLEGVEPAGETANSVFSPELAMSITSVGEDQGTGEVLPNSQLAFAVHECKKLLPKGHHLKILALDACAMALAEVWFELHGCADFGIASEAQEPDGSFPYDRILTRLLLDPGAEPEAVAKMVVDAYVESYAHLKDEYVTLSAVDLREIKHLAPAIRHLARKLRRATADPDARAVIFQARNDCPIFDPDGFIDLGRFCEILEITLPDSEVSEACCEVRRQLESFVAYARYSPLDPTLRISQTTGLSVWFPPWLENPLVKILEKQSSISYLLLGYPETQFAQCTDWDEFLVSMRSLI